MSAEEARQRSRSARSWRKIARDPTIAAIFVYAVITIGAVLAAYFILFTVFATYDDEGTLLVTLKAFVHGDALYRDICRSTGPSTTSSSAVCSSSSAMSVTTDASRTIVLVDLGRHQPPLRRLGRSA